MLKIDKTLFFSSSLWALRVYVHTHSCACTFTRNQAPKIMHALRICPSVTWRKSAPPPPTKHLPPHTFKAYSSFPGNQVPTNIHAICT
jgi:hypothetical protein